MARMPAARPEVPKIAFSVQAIIPGRAWLKSDSGDTVTVAEGDMLKSYGRVTKIDPYDGIVDIDTGTKIVSLSYGLNGE
jgi:intracellular multiplication protein IcmG